MLKFYLCLATLFFFMSPSAQAFNDIDTFITMHCGSACNGESDECRECYNDAVDMYDQTLSGNAEGGLGINPRGSGLTIEF